MKNDKNNMIWDKDLGIYKLPKKLFIATQTLKDFIGEGDKMTNRIEKAKEELNQWVEMHSGMVPSEDLNAFEEEVKDRQWFIEQAEKVERYEKALKEIERWDRMLYSSRELGNFAKKALGLPIIPLKETPTYKYFCIECGVEYTTEDKNLRYCYSVKCIDKVHRLNGPFLVDTPTI